MKLEQIMLNIVKTNPVPVACTGGKYLAALRRLVKKGAVRFNGSSFLLRPVIQ